MLRPINIAVSPNLEPDDFWLAFKTLITGGDLQAPTKVTQWFKNYFGSRFEVFTYNSGRSALYSLLQALGVGEGDEVIVQAFTCVAAIEPILWCQAKPIFADIDANNFNLDPNAALKKITPHTRAIIVQHTFGQPANLAAFVKLCHDKNLLLIEDCALSLGATYKEKKVGTFGDVAFFSFGRDKVISSVFGGVALTQDRIIAKKLAEKYESTGPSPRLWVTQQLLQPLITGLALPVYNFWGLGKFIIWLTQKTGLLSPVYPEKSVTERPSLFPAKLSHQLATLALHQLQKLDRFNAHRRMVAALYFKLLSHANVKLPPKDKDSIYLRFTIQTPQAEQLFHQAQKSGLLLGSWYSDIITAADPEDVGYRIGSCPIAESVAEKILNLPTYPTLSEKQAIKVSEFIKNHIHQLGHPEQSEGSHIAD
ncbi:MAG: DegT/DnrJ/EryC1/StrS family aminotransferase [Candidatus Chisholmbacteria bacterium]|nr:DegT/DnrJ/EryC1/StrS family aminotransferase [Candidatus Chisholmbacteria bacterium]